MLWHSLRDAGKVDYLWHYEHALCRHCAFFLSEEEKLCSDGFVCAAVVWEAVRLWQRQVCEVVLGFGCSTVFASVHSTGCVVFLILSRFCFLMLACATLLVLRMTA